MEPEEKSLLNRSVFYQYSFIDDAGNLYLSGITSTDQLNVLGNTTATTFFGDLAWSYVKNTPTTIGDYGINDVYTTVETNANFVSASTYNTYTGVTAPSSYVSASTFNSHISSYNTYTGVTAPTLYAPLSHTGDTSNPHRNTLSGLTDVSISPLPGDRLTYDGTRWVNSFTTTGITSGAVGLNLLTVTTTNSSVTGFRLRVTAFCSGNTAIMGYWTRCVVIYTSGNTANVMFVNSDVDYQTGGLIPTYLGFGTSNNNVVVSVTGLTNSLINWSTKYELY